jgi:hypothetical protein
MNDFSSDIYTHFPSVVLSQFARYLVSIFLSNTTTLLLRSNRTIYLQLSFLRKKPCFGIYQQFVRVVCNSLQAELHTKASTIEFREDSSLIHSTMHTKLLQHRK